MKKELQGLEDGHISRIDKRNTEKTTDLENSSLRWHTSVLVRKVLVSPLQTGSSIEKILRRNKYTQMDN